MAVTLAWQTCMPYSVCSVRVVLVMVRTQQPQSPENGSAAVLACDHPGCETLKLVLLVLPC